MCQDFSDSHRWEVDRQCTRPNQPHGARIEALLGSDLLLDICHSFRGLSVNAELLLLQILGCLVLNACIEQSGQYTLKLSFMVGSI